MKRKIQGRVKVKNLKKKKRKLRKNSEYKTYIDDTYIHLLFSAIVEDDPGYISQALSYKIIGPDPNECDDCEKDYASCRCEGSEKLYPHFYTSKLIQKECEECNQNRCICEHGINKHYCRDRRKFAEPEKFRKSQFN